MNAIRTAVMLLAGIFLGEQFHPSLFLCLILFCPCLAGGIFFYRRGKAYVLDQPPKRISRVLLSAAIIVLGMGRTALSGRERPEGMIEQFAGGEPVTFVGSVTAPPVISSSRTTLRVQVEKDQPEEK